jgi:hypothetical protein
MRRRARADTLCCMGKLANRLMIGWVLVLAGAAVALLVAWLGRIVSVPLSAVLTTGAVILSLTWLVVLTTVPWNLHFAARRAAQEMAVSRERGIAVRPAYNDEAIRIARRMLASAVAAQLGTAAAAAAVAYSSGDKVGYYIAGIALLSTAFRPAAAYFLHVRERIKVLARESTHPRDDVATLRDRVDQVKVAVGELRAEVHRTAGDLRRAEATLADTIAHTRTLLVSDLKRLEERHVADLDEARSRHIALEHRIEQMARQVEATLDGISDHQEVLTGLRALVRLIRSDQA